MELRAIFAPVCWVFGHLWEYQDYRGQGGTSMFYTFWFCERCGLRSYTKPEGW